MTDDTQSTFREMALKGKQYRETIEFDYYGMSGPLYVRPLEDEEFLPIASVMEERTNMDPEEAKAALEDNREAGEQDFIDASDFDAEFLGIMQRTARLGIDTTQGIAEGEDEDGLEELISMLQGGKTLEIAERILDISSNPEAAEKFR